MVESLPGRDKSGGDSQFLRLFSVLLRLFLLKSFLKEDILSLLKKGDESMNQKLKLETLAVQAGYT
ncbi:MAG: hypothetical protein ACI4UV_07020, partial [Victivallales bacterium]